MSNNYRLQDAMLSINSGLLFIAIQESNIKELQKLIVESPEIINMPNNLDKLPLELACQIENPNQDHQRIIDLLIENGATQKKIDKIDNDDTFSCISELERIKPLIVDSNKIEEIIVGPPLPTPCHLHKLGIDIGNIGIYSVLLGSTVALAGITLLIFHQPLAAGICLAAGGALIALGLSLFTAGKIISHFTPESYEPEHYYNGVYYNPDSDDSDVLPPPNWEGVRTQSKVEKGLEGLYKFFSHFTIKNACLKTPTTSEDDFLYSDRRLDSRM